MPLARVICRSEEEAAPLVQRLRSLGYTVEVAAPGSASPQPADLEFAIESSSLHEALARADQFAQSYPQGQVLFAPGVLEGQELSQAEAHEGWFARVFGRWVHRHQEPAKEAPPAPPLAPAEKFVMPAAPPAARPAHREQEAPQVAGQTEFTDAAQYPATYVHEEPGHQAAPGIAAAEAAEQLRISEQRAAEQRAAEERAAEQRAAEERAVEQRAAEQRLAELRAVELRAAEQRQRLREEAQLRKQQEEREHSAELARRAEALRERERERLAREAEIARRNREAEAEVARMAEEAEHWERTAPVSGERPWPVSAPVDDANARPQAPAEVVVPYVEAPPSPAAPAAARRERPALVPVVASPTAARPRTTRRVAEWRLAAAAGAGFAALLMGAWSLATSPRPAAPLSNKQVQRSSDIQQEVPFGPATIHTAPLPTRHPQLAPVAAPQKQQVNVPSPALAAKSPATSSPKPSAAKTKAKPRRRTRDDRNAVADDDVVIRRYGSAVHPASTGAQANLKHFSDSN